MLSIHIAQPTDPDISALIRDHLASLAPTAPAESRHALAIDELMDDRIRLWSAMIDGQLAGIIARQQLSPTDGEIKSMKTASAFLRRGVAAALLTHLVQDSRAQGLTTLYLETGSADYFRPAHALYQRFGFVDCAPFGNYRPDPNSHFMRLALG